MKFPSQADINEMKARGYDPSVIAEAEKEMKRWPEVVRLCALIEGAFASVTLGNGVGLHEGLGHDDNADDATCAAYRAGDEKDDWRRIPVEHLRGYHSSLSFFDAEGMRFHLPAFLIADLRGEYDCGMAFTLTHQSDHSFGRYSLLNRAQRSAVRAYLRHIVNLRDYQFERSEIEQGLAGYWADEGALDNESQKPISHCPMPPVE
jgi:hypothetical protein